MRTQTLSREAVGKKKLEKMQLEFVVRRVKKGRGKSEWQGDTGCVAAIRSVTECADAGLGLDGSVGNTRGEGRIHRYGDRWSRRK